MNLTSTSSITVVILVGLMLAGAFSQMDITETNPLLVSGLTVLTWCLTVMLVNWTSSINRHFTRQVRSRHFRLAALLGCLLELLGLSPAIAIWLVMNRGLRWASFDFPGPISRVLLFTFLPWVADSRFVLTGIDRVLHDVRCRLVGFLQ